MHTRQIDNNTQGCASPRIRKWKCQRGIRGKSEAPAAARWFLLLLLFWELTAVPLKCCNYHPHKEAHKSTQKHECSVPSGGHHSHMISQCEAGCMNVNHRLWCLAGDDIYLQAKKKRKKTARTLQGSRIQNTLMYQQSDVSDWWRAGSLAVFSRSTEHLPSLVWMCMFSLFVGRHFSQLWYVHCT